MFDLQSNEARLLLSVALMAVGGNRFSSAARILAVLEKFRPDHVSLASAKAIALISAQRFQDAVDYLDGQALVRFPDDPMLLAFKGMALMRLGELRRARGPLQAASAQETDVAAHQLASDMLNDL